MNDDRPPSLDDLDARLRRARERGAVRTEGDGGDGLPRNALGLAFRIGVELVAAMIVGVGGGLLLDRWLGTAPWGLVGMFFLGAGAGIVNVYRAVNGVGMAPGYSRKQDRQPGAPEDRSG
ncbi:MAG TPA: AtpZ/AtpI family protein [Arenibaculum sp.]|nr:AtpZ/AtpI family protein [Arenibaculum sp.]